jgi:DNA (cytosine-5)-methyltransferase 1
MLENVEEFVSWGPLRTARNTGKKMRGTPSQRRKAETFNQFVSAIRGLGYKVEWKELRACDYGAPTIRKRFFLIARCDGRPIVWPQPTHGKPGTGLLPYRTAAEIIDWSIPCPSIFERKRPLADNTMRRIARGIEKYVINNPSPFIVECANASSNNGNASLDNPMRTVTAQTKGGTFALVSPVIERSFTKSECNPADHPLGTITAGGGGKAAVVVPTLVQVGYGEREGQLPRAPGLDKPLGTVVAGGQKHALISAFLAKHYGGVVGTGVDVPTGTVTTADHHSLVTAHVMKMRGENIGHGADEPLHTLSAGGTHFAEVRAFLIKYFGTDGDPRLGDPLHTVTTKDRFGLVTVHGEDYQIVDIGMRMLTPRELYRAQGFPDSYIIDRTADGAPLSKVAQVRMCGNSVSPVMSRVLVAANMNESILYELDRKAA